MTTGEGEPEIRQLRPSGRILMVLCAFAAVALGAPNPASAQEVPPPATAVAAEGTYSLPVWLPLRRDLDGAEVTQGCTYASHGSAFGYECGGHHNRWALDFIAETGTPVYASGAGFATVLTGRSGGSGFGNVVSIDHGFGISTVYAHLSEIDIADEGQWVDETTLIGKVGSTGSSSTAHLHFERRIGDEAADPGPLYACRGPLLVSFPEVAGIDSWQGIAWGTFTVASDGNDCAPSKVAADEAASQWDALVRRAAELLGLG